ncbi:(R)-mandelonitrile lyase 1-like [Benincasa hispida]|uniref:(R)-mandelonitrile lyase 1-like n=1 Tax=Benincasa hispida TaxID=102211 RepID=UPI0019029371|nr:(R)-mandelonitrile lyase 1-like [Benincasa hispida]
MASLFLLILTLFTFHIQIGVLSSQTIPNQDDSFMKFVQNANALTTTEKYDYIIIGGGTAGCPLAATLSSNFSVLVLERGSDPNAFPLVLSQEGMANTLTDDDDGSNPFQRFVSEDGVENIRGRVLGGGSMINVGFYSRAQPEFFQNSGVQWDMKLVEEAYRWIEDTIVSQPELGPWQSAFREALVEAGVGPDNGYDLSHVVGTRIGGSIFDSRGRRHGAVELLNKANPKNLKVATQATVKRIIFSQSNGLTATGVLYSDSKGKVHKATISKNGEIILSAGAIGSPQLLLSSGIGPRSHLSSLKLHVVLDNPHVGQSMADNPRFGAAIVLPFLTPPTSVQVVGTLKPNIHIESLSTILPFSISPPFALLPPRSSAVNLSVAIFAGKFSTVSSTGSLRLDGGKNPIVRFNYLSHPDDLERCVEGVRKVGELVNTQVMERIKTRDLEGKMGFKFLGTSLPENMSDYCLVGEFCRKTVTTFWHYHGGCLVGKVVDGNYKVIGIKNLRVVDGSIFSLSPGTNPMATVMMLGRYVGLKMMEERLGQRSKPFGY